MVKMKLESEVQSALSSNDSAVLEEVFARVYDTYKKLIWHIALDILLNPDIANDITQECFLNYYKKVSEEGVVVNNIKYYLTATCKNMCLKERRRLDSIVELKEDYDYDVYIEASLRQDISLDDIKKNLKGEELRLLKLKVVDQLKFREIAEVLGLSVDAVTSKYTRLINKIKKKMINQEKDK